MFREMRIAKRTGFCYGVREAIDKAKESAAEGKDTHTLGQVVHNEGVIRDLSSSVSRASTRSRRCERGSVVVIRAHGVKPEIFEPCEPAAWRSSTEPAAGWSRSNAS